MWWQLVTMPAVGGMIGWFTNHLAIRMLFRPRRPWRIAGLTVQGVIPRQRAELARRVAETIERDLFSHDDIRQAVLHPDFHDALHTRVEGHLRDYVADKLASTPRLVRAVLTPAVTDKLASGVANEVMTYVPALLEGAVADLEARFDIREVIRAKIEAFDLDHLETMVLELARKELRFIEILGGVLGAVIGLAFALVERCLA